MTRERRSGRRLFGIFLLGVLLFNFPILYLFNRQALLLGIPVLYLYLFAAWLLIILLMSIVSQSKPGRSLRDKGA